MWELDGLAKRGQKIIETIEPARVFCQGDELCCAAWSSDGKRLVGGDAMGRIQVWESDGMPLLFSQVHDWAGIYYRPRPR